MVNNRVSSLLGVQHPIIQAGMLWCSPWQLASAVSNAGGLGLIGSASMYPDIFKEHLAKCKKATDKPFGVNVVLMYPDIEAHMRLILDAGVKVVFTSAGNPKTWTPLLKEAGITVVHVVSSAKFARKAEDAGVDAVVAEGFEAGGHNGREETTTLCLIPSVVEAVDIPVIAAGGIGSGAAMLSAMTLGAEGVQVGSLFAASEESSAHPNFKQSIVDAGEGATELTLKELTPVRLIKNKFYNDIQAAYAQNASREELQTLLGRARAKRGMFEGDMDEGELEIGQVAAQIRDVQPAATILHNLLEEYRAAHSRLSGSSFQL